MATNSNHEANAYDGGLPYSKPIAHACSSCRVQEIDVGLKVADSTNSLHVMAVRYRGTTVYEGIAKKCAFFADCLRSLQPILESCKTERPNDPEFLKLRNWVYEMRFYATPEKKELIDGNARGTWKYVYGLLPEYVPSPETQEYIMVTVKSEWINQ